MNRSCLVLLSVLIIGAGMAGCTGKSRNPAITHDVEDSFRSRWVAKRMNELLASGQAADAKEARIMASEEFRKKYEYTGAAQKGDPVKGATTP